MIFARMLNIVRKICIPYFCALMCMLVGAITVSGSQEDKEVSKSPSNVANSSLAEEEPAFIDWMQDGIYTSDAYLAIVSIYSLDEFFDFFGLFPAASMIVGSLIRVGIF